MQISFRSGSLAAILYSSYCLFGFPMAAAAWQDPLPEVQLKSISSTIELLPPEPGSGSNQARASIRLTLGLELSNTGTGAASITPAHFQLKTPATATPRQNQAANTVWLVAPGNKFSVQLAWVLTPFPREELPLRLEWGNTPIAAPGDSPDQPPVPDSPSPDSPAPGSPALPRPDSPESQPAGSIDLNAELRKLHNLNIQRVGPDGVLAVVASQRDFDLLAIWVLDERLQQLSKAGVSRILFEPAGEGPLKVSGEAGMWISALQGTTLANGIQNLIPIPKPQTQFRFAALAHTETMQDGSPFRQRWMAKKFASSEDGIVEALQSLYRIAPVQQALRDLESPNPGVRRAALAGAVDRLTEEQANRILEKTIAGTAQQQRELASLLNQLPGRRAIETLRELALADKDVALADKDIAGLDSNSVAAAALAGLATSQDETAITAMAEIWDAGNANPKLRTLAAAAMVRSDDARWTAMVAAWVQETLDLAVAGQTAAFSRPHFSSAVARLIDWQHEPTLARLRSTIASVKLTELQDELITCLVQSGQPADLAAVKPVITTRLQNGSVSREVRDAAATLRDNSWAALLIDDFWRSATAGGRNGDESLRVILLCAAPPQLEQLLESWDKLPRNARAELLSHLAQQDHPAWRSLAESTLNNPSEISNIALSLLAEDASEESIQILLRRARNLVDDFSKPDAPPAAFQNAQQTLATLSLFTHPECRRLLNLAARSPNAEFKRQINDLRGGSRARSPGQRLLYEHYQLRRAGNEEAATKMLELALQADPFLPEAWVRHASLSMHAGNFDESMKDLKRANDLSPDHEEVLSMIALVLVRQGKLEEGLAATEDLVRQAPKDLYALYNGACSYARAAERPDTTPEKRTLYTSRAIELLQLNNDAGHDDHEHMSTDPDLIALHDHPQWPGILEAARQNEKNNLEKNR